jgi:hypothetical protein
MAIKYPVFTTVREEQNIQDTTFDKVVLLKGTLDDIETKNESISPMVPGELAIATDTSSLITRDSFGINNTYHSQEKCFTLWQGYLEKVIIPSFTRAGAAISCSVSAANVQYSGWQPNGAMLTGSIAPSLFNSTIKDGYSVVANPVSPNYFTAVGVSAIPGCVIYARGSRTAAHQFSAEYINLTTGEQALPCDGVTTLNASEATITGENPLIVMGVFMTNKLNYNFDYMYLSGSSITSPVSTFTVNYNNSTVRRLIRSPFGYHATNNLPVPVINLTSNTKLTLIDVLPVGEIIVPDIDLQFSTNTDSQTLLEGLYSSYSYMTGITISSKYYSSLQQAVSFVNKVIYQMPDMTGLAGAQGVNTFPINISADIFNSPDLNSSLATSKNYTIVQA